MSTELSIEVPSRQEMFNRAWRGLKSQGWRHARDARIQNCAYYLEDGRRCAWGWVDPEGTKVYGDGGGTVRDLARLPVRTLAARLSDADLSWAWSLQKVHDDTRSAEDLERCMRRFAEHHALTIPE